MAAYFALAATQGARAQSAQDVFWNWFLQNQSFIEEIGTRQEAVLDAVEANLRTVEDGLSFEIGRGPTRGFEFIISADGRPELFSDVIKLADAAPDIDGWKIVAFRPRLGPGFAVNLGPYEISADTVWYKTETFQDRPGVVLFVEDLDGRNRQPLMTASYILLNTVLGEYDTVTKLSFVEFEPLPSDPANQGLRQLSQLASEIDDFYGDGR